MNSGYWFSIISLGLSCFALGLVIGIKFFLDQEEKIPMSKIVKRLDIAKRYISENIERGACGLFFTASLCLEDKKVTLYEGEGLEILLCYEWEYFEVFGLTYREQTVLKKYYENLLKSRRK